MRKILVTGFNPFGKVKVNPSQLAIEALAEEEASRDDGGGCRIITALLPTEYARATARMRRLLRRERPAAVVCLGVAAGRREICLERFALNLDDEQLPDNAGVVRRNRIITRGGPALYRSTLPLDRMLRALRQRRIPARVSNHAGTFLCNHVFYVVRHETRRRALPAGFIHLPAIRGVKSPGLPLSVMRRAIGICLAEVSRLARVAQPRRRGSAR